MLALILAAILDISFSCFFSSNESTLESPELTLDVHFQSLPLCPAAVLALSDASQSRLLAVLPPDFRS